MSVVAKPLIGAKYAVNSNFTEYVTPDKTRTIIDNFVAINQSGSAVTVSIYIVPFAQTLGNQHYLLKALSVASGASVEITIMKNQILSSGDFIVVNASAATSLVIRASGREIA